MAKSRDESTQERLVEWMLAALKREDSQEDVWRVAEMVQLTGWTEHRVRKAVKRLLAEGKMEVADKVIVRMDGRTTTVSAYRLLPGGKR